MQAGKQDAVLSQIPNYSEIVVFEGVPEVRDFASDESEPVSGMGCDVAPGFARPIAGHLGAFQLPPGCRLCLFDRIAEQLRLTSVKSRKARVAGGVRVVAEPKIDATVGGEEHRVARE